MGSGKVLWIEETIAMDMSSRTLVMIFRVTLWAASFYLLGLLLKIYYHADVGFKNSLHVLGIGIFFFTLFVMGILYQTRYDKEFKEQKKHILRATILLTVVYGLCCLLAFAFFDKWSFPYLWFG